MSNLYRRITKTMDAKGKLIPLGSNVYDYIKDRKVDYYLSVYIYNEQQKEKFYSEITKEKDGKPFVTINGAAGISDVFTDQLVFDFDSEGDLELAKKDTVEAYNRLVDRGFPEESIQIYYSGKKGFGIVIKVDEYLDPKQHKNISSALMEGLETFDPKIYNASRILRVPLTKHNDTGRYKISLMRDDLDQDSSVIVEWSKQEYDPDNDLPEYITATIPDNVKLIANKEVKKEEHLFDTLDSGVNTLDLSEKPRDLSNWKYALSQGYFPPSTRNHALMILAATYKGQKKNRTETYYMLKAAADLQSKKFDQEKYSKEEIWKNVINTVYSPQWQGGTYAEDSFPDDIIRYFDKVGIKRGEQEEESNLIENIKDGFTSFAEYARRIEEYTMKFGIESLDDKLKCRKGHLIYMLAPPGAGKTSFAIAMLNNMSRQGTACYFGSYDMYKNNVYQKLIQRHTGLDEDTLFDVFVRNDKKKIEEFREILQNEYANVSFCYKVGQSISDLKRSIAREEEKMGKRVELVVVDYLELVLTDAKDPTAASAEAAQGLREVANEGRVVLGLLQPNKFNSTPADPILSYNAAKGSSSIAQSGTAVITGHRPGMNSENNNKDDKFFSINCVKNRNGSLFALDFGWDGRTQTIYELDDAQRAELRGLRERKKAQKAMEDL